MWDFFNGNRVFRGCTNRSNEKLAAQFGPGPGTAILAVSLGYACYPKSTYGDKAILDNIVAHLKKLSPGPCNATKACEYVENWLDKGIGTTEVAFINVWGSGPNEFLMRFMEETKFGGDGK